MKLLEGIQLRLARPRQRSGSVNMASAVEVMIALMDAQDGDPDLEDDDPDQEHDGREPDDTWRNDG